MGYWSCTVTYLQRGLVDLTRYLLKCGNDCVILGWFTTDPLEKSFSKLHQGSSGTYFITAQSVIEKVRIDHAKLALRLNVEVERVDRHTCQYCYRELNEEECEIIDNLADLESNGSKETLLVMYRKDATIPIDDTTYYKKYGNYLNALNRGGCTVPSDNCVQWTIFYLPSSQENVGHFNT